MNGGPAAAYPDTLVGTDSHTTMVNGLGVLGWGVGGIEAEAAMLDQPVSMLIPQVVGVQLVGQLAGRIDRNRSRADHHRDASPQKGWSASSWNFMDRDCSIFRSPTAPPSRNMAPEYGATCGIFPVDKETLRYLRLTGRSSEQIALGRGLLQGAGTVPHCGDAGSRVLQKLVTRLRPWNRA